MTTQLVSPYACAKIVNAWLAEDGVQKKLPPQMFYQYTSPKKAYIPTVVVGDKLCVDVIDLRSWYDEKYMKRARSNEVVSEDDGTVGEW
jgi:hypothetical protein